MPLAIRARNGELPWLAAEYACQQLDLRKGEAALPTIAVAFGGAHGRAARPAHERAELCLGPSVALTQNADVDANGLGLCSGDLPGTGTPPGHQAIPCQITV
jgi:hypothetical protein